MVAKRRDRRVLLQPAETPVENRERNAGLFETLGDMRERLARMDEDQLLLGRVAPNQVDERRLLAAGFDRRPPVGKFSPDWIAGISRRDPCDGPRSGLGR